ncbi:MAG: hypothetical protein AVDCRST_MAG86-3751 [uncultured Truepera sp.]|uniref:Uncharacterized protein n=1 Tax=uncultured Truepera sp. TaxID=543023 RepID=A0A6J4VV31_9DEIN|nr:MAG: hypothetical protein AVDCRST_MAG86-3751 [uncultured Truepera sp.]
MGFTNKQVRVWSRWIHLIGAWLIGAFVYSPGRDEAWFVLVMQLGVIPVLTLTGIAMWKQALVGRWLGTGHPTKM